MPGLKPTPGEIKARTLVRKARQTNAKRDEMDRKVGFGPPGTGGAGDLLRTAMCAIEAGMATGDWPCVAEGYCMLQQLHQQMFVRNYGIDADG